MRSVTTVLAAVLAFATANLSCPNDARAAPAAPSNPAAPSTPSAPSAPPDATTAGASACDAPDGAAVLTPLTMQVAGRPIPVEGSDGRYHVVYEIELVNATGDAVSVQQLTVLDARDRRVVGTFDAAQLASRLVVRDAAATPGRIGAAQAGIVYVNLAFDSRDALPGAIDHRMKLVHRHQPGSQGGACTPLAAPTDLLLDPPLRGPRFIAGDGCCDVIRHMRSTLPFNGRYHTAQRFAIDWEQLDEQGRIYAGDPKNPLSYVIYGQPAYAVADARVAAVVDGLPDWPPGSFPPNLPIEQADGNHVILDLGDGRYALYAHLKARSIPVRVGERVRRGQELGRVGTSGNSSEPHLHFHVTDGPSALASNGVPYRLSRFSTSQRGVSTAAFDRAIVDGRPIATEPVASPGPRSNVLPLNLWIVDFAP